MCALASALRRSSRKPGWWPWQGRGVTGQPGRDSFPSMLVAIRGFCGPCTGIHTGIWLSSVTAATVTEAGPRAGLGPCEASLALPGGLEASVLPFPRPLLPPKPGSTQEVLNTRERWTLGVARPSPVLPMHALMSACQLLIPLIRVTETWALGWGEAWWYLKGWIDVPSFLRLLVGVGCARGFYWAVPFESGQNRPERPYRG